MLALYQFELSQFSEKVRLILDYKGLEYKKIEVTPGIGQLDVYKMSGQRQVPVLKDGDTVISDSTEIAFYLDRKYPEKPIIPTAPVQRAQCLIMEEWADESIGLKGRKAFIGALNQNPNFRTSIVPKQVPDLFKNLLGAVPGDVLDFFGAGVGLGGDAVKEAQRGLRQDLEALTLLVQQQPYLIGDQPTLADFSVAALSILLKFPEGNYFDIPDYLKGKGIPGLGDNAEYAPFFEWRDRLYREFRQETGGNRETKTEDGAPTTIEID
ncbi:MULTISPECIES: glutathione S-transferase [Cyanophyceae]|uniref:glutathione S-transferase n=1 Tax=Cyanophyceae TaxID=3028117 RepID=UPI0004A9E797|nr:MULTISPECIES: glutathione S-transferase family protein [Cyanophyceae]